MFSRQPITNDFCLRTREVKGAREKGLARSGSCFPFIPCLSPYHIPSPSFLTCFLFSRLFFHCSFLLHIAPFFSFFHLSYIPSDGSSLPPFSSSSCFYFLSFISSFSHSLLPFRRLCSVMAGTPAFESAGLGSILCMDSRLLPDSVFHPSLTLTFQPTTGSSDGN